MKRFLSILSLAILGLVSTSCYDDTQLKTSIQDLEGRVTTLETLCSEMNSNITALRTLVNAMSIGDYVVSVSPLKEDGVEVGSRIVFKESGVVDLYHGEDGADGADGADGKDGANGKDGHTPVLGTKQDTDGLYYWTIDGEWVIDAEGKKIPLVTVGATPQLKIEDETWYVSYDDGKTWEQLGAAVTVGIKDFQKTDDALVITMTDGTSIEIPMGAPLKVVLGEFDASTLQYGSDLVIPYTIEGVEDDVIVFLLSDAPGLAVELIEESAYAGKVVVEQLEASKEELTGKIGIMAVAEDGTTVTKAIRITSGVFYEVEGNQSDYSVAAAGGKIEFKIATNKVETSYKVETSAEWISLLETKAVVEKTLVFNVEANIETEARTAEVTLSSGDIELSFTVNQASGTGEVPFEESLVGAYKIQKLWVYGGTGPAYGGGGWVDLHNKTWWFDETTGHGIKAELDNYIEFTFTEVNAEKTQSTGKCVNWAGADGKNWDTWFYNNLKADGTERNPDAPLDGSNFYRQIPIGESTWVRDYTVTPNTVTFTDADGRKTVLELLEPGYEFTTNKYNDSNADANKRTFPRTEGDDLTFHAKLSGWKEVWPARYSELDKIFDCPRDFFIDVIEVEEIPAASKTTEAKWTPEFPDSDLEYPESIAGTYKYSKDVIVSDTAAKGLVDQYGTWTEPLTDDGRPFNTIINSIKDDIYVFTATGNDANGNETGTVTFDDGGTGTWEYQVMDNQSAKPYTVYDATELYGFIAHDNTTTYVYDRNEKTITFTTRGKEYVVDYLLPGAYKYSEKDVTVPDSSTFALHYDQGFTEARIADYKHYNGLRHVYVQARHWVLCLVKQ